MNVPDVPITPAPTPPGPPTVDLPVPAVALAIGAHPDDVEFGAGGTLAKWAAAGCTVHHLVCTDGSKGTWDVDQDRVALAEQRQGEQRAAARSLGATGEVVFLGHVDGELTSGLDLVADVARTIRRLRPTVVLGHDPWRRYRLHPDHLHAGRLAVEGIVGARDPHFFPDQPFAHHRPDTLLLWEADVPTHVEDITSSIAAKIDGLADHRSQFRTTMGVDLDADDGTISRQWTAFDGRVRDRAHGWAAWAGLGSGRLAEGFARIDA